MLIKMQYMNEKEKEVYKVLKELQDNCKYIALQLHPPLGKNGFNHNEGNTIKINEGRDGIFHGQTEVFYGQMVDEFDSRYR